MPKGLDYARQYEAIEDDSEGGGFAPYQYQVLSHVGRSFAR